VVSSLPDEITSRFQAVPVPEPEPIEAAPTGSVVDLIKERRRDHAVEYTYDMLLPGYQGCLAIRCKAIEMDTVAGLPSVARSARNTQNAARLPFTIACDVIIAACQEVVARERYTEPWQPLDRGGESVGLDERLAKTLEIEAPTARLLLVKLFSLAPSPQVAISAAADNYVDWLRGADADLDEELLGES
jgi:hypothetical protein